MSIKVRLVLSYIAMTFIPVVLFISLAATLGSVIFKDAAANGDGKGVPAFWAAGNERNELVAGVKFMARTDPDRFADSGFLKSTDDLLNRVQAGLVVMKGGKMAYVSPFVDSSHLQELLSGAQTRTVQHHWGPLAGRRFMVDKYEIAFSDRSSGMVYVLSDMNLFIESAKKVFPPLALTLLAVIGITNGILTYAVSRSFIKPLYALKHAAEQIKEGNLDYEVKLKRKDEIGKLGAAFEEMRNRLNESIRLQLQYEENRKELIANITHDLKTPITGMKACVEGIRDGIADTASKREKYINMIAKKTEEMDRLIDELTLFSTLDLKRLPFHLEPMDLKAYLRDCVDEMSLDPRIDGVDVTFSGPRDRSLFVMADREKLRRVIMNIVDNSLKYMDKEPRSIRVELMDGETEATVCIQDNGPGIEGAALPYIFDRFYRTEPSRSTAMGGSGLGLAIVKQIVEGQGGAVWAESRMGEGTSIYFTLPKTRHGGERS